jgi:four helix bundle protein
MEIGSWKFETGSWKLEAGSWKVEVGSWKLASSVRWRLVKVSKALGAKGAGKESAAALREIRVVRTDRITDFTDLECWQLARKLRHEIYKITRAFPKFEQFNLVKHMREASLSVTSNIAEGYGRYHFQENLQFCRIARGSLCEIKDDLIAALDEGYIPFAVFEALLDLQEQAARSLNGYIRSTRRWLVEEENP